MIDVDKPLLRSLMVLGATVEARDPYTGGHVWRIANYAKLLAQRLGRSDSDIFAATVGGWLHDIGKIGIPDAILHKRGPLSGDERGIIRRHPLIGHDLVADHPLEEWVLDAVMFHHERYDGQGYPHHLGGKDIPPVARMIAIADAFDAMTSVRPYQGPRTKAEAIDTITAESERQFDPEMAAAFTELAEAGVLDDLIGFSDFGTPLVLCPHCGPVIAVPRVRPADFLPPHCTICAGEYQPHAASRVFEYATVNFEQINQMIEPF